jgi:hypothetical protein
MELGGGQAVEGLRISVVCMRPAGTGGLLTYCCHNWAILQFWLYGRFCSAILHSLDSRVV